MSQIINPYEVQVDYRILTWDRVKRYLYDRKRVDELCNKGTGNEVLTTWNGVTIRQWNTMDWFNALYRSGRPTRFIDHKGKTVRTEPAPGTKKNHQLKLF